MPIVRLRSIAPLVTGLVFSGCSAATTAQGTGANGAPPAARVAPATASGTLTTLYSFQGQPDGAVPKGGVNVYNCEPCPLVIFGNTSAGGANGAGTVYELYRPWRGSFSEYVLLSYSGASDGSGPVGTVVSHLASGSEILGTAPQGGLHGEGTVVQLHGSGTQYRETKVHSFDGRGGAAPSAGLTWRSNSLHYGTTFSGGRYGRGAILSVANKGLKTKVLYSFSGKSDGRHPNSTLGYDLKNGHLYGTTAGSSKDGDWGSVYDFAPDHTVTTIYSFHQYSDGATPTGVVGAINLFGTTEGGGASGYGTIYELKPNGSNYTKITLHTFAGGSGDGADPQGSLSFYGIDMYGTTTKGGSANCGTLFRIDIYGNYTVLYSFTCGDDGAYPNGDLAIEGNVSSGTYSLYGTTAAGGTANQGTVFRFDP